VIELAPLTAESTGTGWKVWDVLERLVAIEDRSAGKSGERQGAAIVQEAFKELGVRETSTSEFEMPVWRRGQSSLRADREYIDDHQVISLPGSPSGTVTAELIDAEYCIPGDISRDVEGKIMMARSGTPGDHPRPIHRMEKYASAVKNGALGFVFRNDLPGCLPQTGEIGYHNRPGPIPAVGVSKEVGAWLEGGKSEVELTVDCQTEAGRSVNTTGVVGPDTDKEVLVTAHVDAHDIGDGALDNGVGSALLPEIARLLLAVEDVIDTTVRFVAFGAEEPGLYGAYHWTERHDLAAVKCVINIDGSGTSRNLRLISNGFDEITNVFETVTDRLDAPLGTYGVISPHGDQWPFLQEGVPTVTAATMSNLDERGWTHTHADTLDKVDPRDLRELAVVLANGVLELAAADVDISHRPRGEIRDEIDAGYELEMKFGGRWPYN